VLAVIGIAAIPGVSDALVPLGASSVHVSVKPSSGPPTTHFVVSFKATQNTGVLGGTGDRYRVAASDAGRAGCQASIATVAPPTRAAATVRVKLAPRAHTRWCPGTFQGEVWKLLYPPCPTDNACPAIAFPPLMVGKFSFRVTRG